MVNRITEKVRMELLSGESAEIELNKYITYREQQKLRGIVMEKVTANLKSIQNDDVMIDASRLVVVSEELAKMLWADKTYTIDDVSSHSLSEVIQERLEKFL